MSIPMKLVTHSSSSACNVATAPAAGPHSRCVVQEVTGQEDHSRVWSCQCTLAIQPVKDAGAWGACGGLPQAVDSVQ